MITLKIKPMKKSITWAAMLFLLVMTIRGDTLDVRKSLHSFIMRQDGPASHSWKAEKAGAPLRREGVNRQNRVLQTAEAIRRALMHNDLEALKALYAEDYAGVDIRGERDDLELILQAYRPGAVRLEAYQVEDMQVDVFAEIAVIRGTGRISGTFQDHAFSHTVRFTDIYKKTAGRWRCWRSHLTEVQTP